MARPKKNQDPVQTIADAINAPTGEFIADIAEKLDISIGDLRERLASKLDNDDPLDWDVVTPEYFAHIDAIARDLDAERSTRKLEPQVEAPQLPEASEPPIEQKPKRRRSSSALTEKKEKVIKETRQAATQTNKGVADALTLLQAQSGIQDGSNAATAYLAGYNTSLINAKAQGLTVIAAETLKEISEKRDFDPNEVLQQIGVPLSGETLDAVNAAMGEILGKTGEATAQVMQTSWGNGISWQDELTDLTNLLNSND